ncbi:MAG: methyltransferase [Candidatus Omnitrophica bacterium]|nr:methyltransferase [Candidatus Omnitrophota bacterium]
MRQMMEEERVLHREDMDEVIERHAKNAKDLFDASSLEDLKKEFMERIVDCGANNMLSRLKATLASTGGQVQVIFVKSEDELPVFEGKKVWGHAGTSVTAFALESEKDSKEGRREIIARLFHEIRARSTLAGEFANLTFATHVNAINRIPPVTEAKPVPQAIDITKPLLVVFDLHGTLLKPSWKEAHALAYAKIKDVSQEEALIWLENLPLKRLRYEFIQLLSQATGVSEAKAREYLKWAQKHCARIKTPEVMPGALEFMEALYKKGVPMVIISGSKRDVVMDQLRERGFLKFIPAEMVVSRDDVALSAPRAKNDSRFREAAIESLTYKFQGYRLAHFNDWVGGIRSVKKRGGIAFGLPQGEGEEKDLNSAAMEKEGADLMINGWHNWKEILAGLQINEKLQKENRRVPVYLKKAKELQLVLPARRPDKLTLFIDVSDDLRELTYYEVEDDDGVMRYDGSIDYGRLKLRKICRLPSSYLISPERYMNKHLTGEAKASIYRVWPQGKRYTRYRNIITSWDKEVDRDVWTTNIDTVYLHKCIEDSGLLDFGGISRAIEIGTGGGHLSVLLASRIPNLKEIIITDISMYALEAAKRVIMPFMNKGLRLRTYLGKGLGTIREAKADLVVVNPPYIPTPPFIQGRHVDPYRGTGLIREVLEKGIYKLNPKNPNACIVMNVSSMAQKQFQEYTREFGDNLTVEKFGEPLRVPLKISGITDEWRQWLVNEGGLEYSPNCAEDEEPYHHTLQAYIIKPRSGAVKTWAVKEKDKIESNIYTDTDAMIRLFRPLLNPQATPEENELKLRFPEIYGYLLLRPEEMNFDAAPAPLAPERNLTFTNHILKRGFGRKLLGLENEDFELFQKGLGVQEAEFTRLCRIVSALKDTDILPYIRCAFLYHDVAKAQLPELKKEWEKLPGIDFRISNKASAIILRNLSSRASRRKGLFENIDLFNKHPHNEILNEFFYRIIETRGFAGQQIRGELSYDVFEDFTRWIRDNFSELQTALGFENRDAQACSDGITDIIYLFNFIDAASLREGLMTTRLNEKFREFFADFRKVITPSAGNLPVNWRNILSDRWNDFRTTYDQRNYLKDRLGRFRQERRDLGENESELNEFIDSMSPEAVKVLTRDLQHFQGWYVESATFGLTPEAMLKIVMLSIVLAKRKGADLTRPFHVNFFNLMRMLSSDRHDFDSYRIRMVETLVRDLDLDDIILKPEVAGRLDLDADDQSRAQPLLGAVSMAVNGTKSISFDFHFSEEAEHLLHLVHKYEKSDSVKFHQVLKLLLDAYGIRKDEFDRVSNEASYLNTMALSKNDKTRLLRYGKGPVWVDIGPADGVTLEIAEMMKEEKGLENIVAVEKSQEAINALRRRIKLKSLSAMALKGDARDLTDILENAGIKSSNTIIFSAVLHEIFSYAGKDGRSFNIETVKDVLRAALRSLAPGGRLLIRDGLIPEDGEETQILELKGRNNKEVFDYYVRNFAGRDLSRAYEVIDEDTSGEIYRIRMKRKDVMEFLFTLTWCYRPQFSPDSLPYEVREQYGVLTRSGYIKLIQELAREENIDMREVEMPEDERTYIQQGYVDNLKGIARLMTLDGKEAPLPPSNMMIVVEKTDKAMPPPIAFEKEWEASRLDAGQFLSALSPILGLETVIDHNKPIFVFSEKVAFDNNLVRCLPKLAEKDIKVAVIVKADNYKAKALIDKLNEGKTEDKKILQADTIDGIRKAAADAKISAPRFYYFRIKDSEDPAFEGRNITMYDLTPDMVKRIIDAIGTACGVEIEKLPLLQELAHKFAEAA